MLAQMLKELDSWLISKNKRITLHVIGGYALELKNIQRGFQTEDIDSVLEISEVDVIEKINSIGEKYNNQGWFDFGASSLTVPVGYETRLEKVSCHENIDLYVLCNTDIIKLKVAAYHSRRERGIYRDIEDLKMLNPTKEEIKEAVEFYYKEFSKDLSGKFLMEFREEIDALEAELLRICK